MPKIENQKLHNISFAFHEAFLERCGKDLDKATVPDKELANMAFRLDKLRTAIQSTSAKDFLAKCYGKVRTLTTNNLVDHTFDQTLFLVQNKNKMSREELKKKVGAIEKQIAKLLKSHALSLPNRHLIKMATFQLKQLRNSSSSQTVSARSKARKEEHLVSVIKKELSCLSPSDFTSNTEKKNIDFALHLYEVARNLYHNHIDIGIRELRHLAVTKSSPFREFAEKLKGEVSSLCADNVAKKIIPLKTESSHATGKRKQNRCSPALMRLLKKIVSYADGFTQKDPIIISIPSDSEIHTIFQEAEQFYEK